MKCLALGAALLALAALAGPVRAADTPAAPLPTAPWYKRWFGIGPDPVVPPRPPKRDPAAEAASLRLAAENELHRRTAVCDQLRQIAYEHNDSNLENRALELEQQAWEIYRRKTAHLPCNRLMPSDDGGPGSRLIGAPTNASAAERLTSVPAIEAGRRAQASAVREIKP